MCFIDISRIGILGENIKVDDIVIKKKILISHILAKE